MVEPDSSRAGQGSIRRTVMFEKRFDRINSRNLVLHAAYAAMIWNDGFTYVCAVLRTGRRIGLIGQDSTGYVLC